MKFLSWLDTHKKYIKIACAIVIGLNCLLVQEFFIKKIDEYCDSPEFQKRQYEMMVEQIREREYKKILEAERRAVRDAKLREYGKDYLLK